jgi:hypothetical protein
MDKIRGLEVLKGVVKENLTHEDYDRVTELADKYFKLDTGKKIEDLLARIITRETEEEFKQRTDITKSVCPAVLNSTKLPYQKVTRKQPIVRKIDYPGDTEAKKLELESYISKYWGDKSLEKYLEYSFVEYNYTDPNAFLITEFASFDNLKEKAQPYPFIATSLEAIMFEYHNEILDYLIVKLPITYLDKGSPQPGFKFTMYLGWDTIVLEQVSEDEKFAEDVIEIEKKYYRLTYFEPKNEKVPAIRFGFIRDTETKGRTFVSVFHVVLAYLEKTLKIDSELDVSISMTAFPQRIMFVSLCNNPGCNHGYFPDGKECEVCHGSGKQPFHRGAMDVLTFDMPRDLTQMFDLNNVVVTKGPLIELLTFMKDYIQTLMDHVHTLMFSNNIATREEVTVAVTATATNFGEDNRNDALYSFACHYSAVWEFVVRDIATFTDLIEGLEVQHKFPNDFKLKGIDQLMTELKMAKDAAASTSTISAIEDDINEILYSDRPDELKEMRIKNEINPFRGYKNEDIRFIISQGNTPIYQRTLWENFESIFQDLESENQDPWLFDLSYDLILAKVKIKTQEYVANIQGEQQAQAEKDAEMFAKQNPFSNQQ